MNETHYNLTESSYTINNFKQAVKILKNEIKSKKTYFCQYKKDN